MAVGGLACTGCSGEDYAIPGYNALVLETDDPQEFIGLYSQLRTNPALERAIRRAGSMTAKQYTWAHIIQRILVPRLQLTMPVAEPMGMASSKPQEKTPMHVRIEGKQLQIPPQLLGWIAERLEDLNSSHEDIDQAHVTLRKRQRQGQHRDEARIEFIVGETALQVTQSGDTLYEAALAALKAVGQELRKLRVRHPKVPALTAS
jgi:ribosome-associated translation inhibitor RaiA